MKVEKSYKIGACCALAILLFTYYWIFSDSLNQFSEETPYSFIDSFLIIDTIIYHDVINQGNGILGIINSTVKNTIIPSFIWYLADGNWILVLIFNIIIYYFMLGYIIEICDIYRISFKQIIIILTLAPATFFYMMGSLKELPTMILLLGFFVNSIRRNYFSMFIILILLTLLRYQIIASIVLYILLVMRSSEKSLLTNAVIAIVVLAGLFPLIHEMSVLSNDATELFRLESQGFGIGSIIEEVRNKIFGISAIAVLLRIFQTIYEPLLYLISPNQIAEGVFSIYPTVSMLSFIMFSVYFYRFLVGFANSKIYKYDDLTQKLYAYILTLLVPTAGFSFVHHRYIYPLYPLIAIASIAYQQGRKR